ncbi:hypothetical protein D3C86_2136060 [compost metagenome]
MIEQCNEQDITHVENPQVTADFIFVLVDGAYFYLSMESDKKAYLDRLAYYKQKAYDALSISPLKAASVPAC